MQTPADPVSWIWPVALWPVESLLRRRYRRVVAIMVVLLVANEMYFVGPDLPRWDWLFISGCLTLVVALRSALRLPEKVHEALDRLTRREVLADRWDDVDGFELQAHAAGRRGALVGGIVIPAIVLVAWILAKRGALPNYLLTTAVEVAASVPVGLFIGRAVSYGRLGRRLRARRFVLDVDPEHLDGAAGLRPVGDLYFFQAMLLAVPAGYLGVWWLIIPVVRRYADWRAVYVGLLLVVILCEAAAFWLPMRSFHLIMKAAKERLLADADRISHEVAQVRRELRHSGDETERQRLETHIDRLSRRYAAIDGMRTWPVDVRIQRRFAVNNVILFVPVVAQLLGAPDSWQHLVESLQKALTGQG